MTNLKEILTRKEKGQLKRCLIEIYKNDKTCKEKNTICNLETLANLITLLEENKDFLQKDVENLKICLDGFCIYAIESKVPYMAGWYKSKILESGYKKTLKVLKTGYEQHKKVTA